MTFFLELKDDPMLSRYKNSQLAAVAALAVIFGASAAAVSTAQAQGGPGQMERQGGQDVGRGPAQMERQGDGQDKSRSESRGDQRRDAGSSREIKSGSDVNVRSSTSAQTEIRGDRDRDRSRITIRDRDRDRDRITLRHRDRDHDRWRWRSRHSFAAVSFVILGPSVVYRSYGSGWCRALHRGQHWAPRIGWHSGRHVGAVRCR
jgi:hypothetical protein